MVNGLRDWLIQRVTAIVMAIYLIIIFIAIMLLPTLDYSAWHGLFSPLWMKVATLLFLACILYHAWIGIWTIFTDYIKPAGLRLILNMLVLCALIAFFFYGLLILWSV